MLAVNYWQLHEQKRFGARLKYLGPPPPAITVFFKQGCVHYCPPLIVMPQRKPPRPSTRLRSHSSLSVGLLLSGSSFGLFNNEVSVLPRIMACLRQISFLVKFNT